MYLTASTLVPYLLQKGILTHADLLDGEWRVQQADPRRPVLRVMGPGQRGWVVKQASPLDRNHVAMLDREAAVFEMAQRVEWARPLPALLPALRLHDPGVHALTVAWLPHDTGLDALRREAAPADRIGALLGRAVASVHVRLTQRNATGGMLSERLPWILQVGSADLDDMHRPAVHRLVDLVRGEPRLLRALTGLAGQWRNDTLIHGDAKLDNVLLRLGSHPRAWFVDWAYCGIGDPAWDVGTIVHSCLVLWLHGIPFQRDPREQALVQALDQAAFALALARDFIGAFLSAYESARALEGAAARAFARRVFLYAAAAMVQTAVASARTLDQLTPRQLAVIQAASHMLDDPDDTLREFRRA